MIIPIGINYDVWSGTTHKILNFQGDSTFEKLLNASAACSEGDKIDLQGEEIIVDSQPNTNSRGYVQPEGTLLYSSVPGARLVRAARMVNGHYVIKPEPYPEGKTPSGIDGITVDGNARNQNTLLCNIFSDGSESDQSQYGISTSQGKKSPPYLINNCTVQDTSGGGIRIGANVDMEIYNTILTRCRMSGIVYTRCGGSLYISDCTFPTERLELEWNPGDTIEGRQELEVHNTVCCQISLLPGPDFTAVFHDVSITNARLFGGAEPNPVLDKMHHVGSEEIIVDDIELLFFGPDRKQDIIIDPGTPNEERLTILAEGANGNNVPLSSPSTKEHPEGAVVIDGRAKKHLLHISPANAVRSDVLFYNCNLKGDLSQDGPAYDAGVVSLNLSRQIKFIKCAMSQIDLRAIDHKYYPDFEWTLANCSTQRIQVTEPVTAKKARLRLIDCNPCCDVPGIYVSKHF